MPPELTEADLNADAGIPGNAPDGSTPPEAGSAEDNSQAAGGATEPAPGAGEDPQLKAAVRGIHQKAQEAADLRRERDALKQQLDLFQQGLKDPNFVKTLNEHYSRVNGNGREVEPSEEEMIQKTGLDKDLLGAFDRYLAARGVLRRGDPELMEAQQLLYGLANTQASSVANQLQTKYTDFRDHEPAVRDLVRRSGGALTLEQAYHAITGGNGKGKEQQRREEVDAKARANLPRAGKQASQPGKPRTYQSFDEAFMEAMKEQGITSFRSR